MDDETNKQALDTPELPGQAKAPPLEEGETAMTKKKSVKKKAKTMKAQKSESGGRKRAVVSGALVGAKPAGETYLRCMFDEGHIQLTPTSNRKANRDLMVKAINALVKSS